MVLRHAGTLVKLAVFLCIAGVALIVGALLVLSLCHDACYSPIILSGAGALLFLGGIGVGSYVRYRMTR